MIKKSVIRAGIIILFSAVTVYSGNPSVGPYHATGIKIGEVTNNSAIVWTRLTRHRHRSSQPLMPKVEYYDAETGEPAKSG